MDDQNLIQKDLIKKIVGDARGAVGIRLCAIGVDLGIFDRSSSKRTSNKSRISRQNET